MWSCWPARASPSPGYGPWAPGRCTCWQTLWSSAAWRDCDWKREKTLHFITLNTFIWPFKSVVGYCSGGIPPSTDHHNIVFIITVPLKLFFGDSNASWDCDEILNNKINIVIFSLYIIYDYWQKILQIDVLLTFSQIDYGYLKKFIKTKIDAIIQMDAKTLNASVT